MTKAELIAAMKKFSDDMDVKICFNIKGYENIVSVIDVKSVYSGDHGIYIQPYLNIEIK